MNRTIPIPLNMAIFSQVSANPQQLNEGILSQIAVKYFIDSDNNKLMMIPNEKFEKFQVGFPDTESPHSVTHNINEGIH